MNPSRIMAPRRRHSRRVKFFKSAILLGTGLTLALSTGQIAAAQDDDEEFRGLEEIIVTASKRAESLQEAGMAITAISELELERMGADGFIDFAVRVPNLGFGNESDGRFNANSPAIRGIFGVGTTGFYIDDMPIPASMQPRVIDLTRIEVLRGPQGTLYGARSMGGTIRLITKQPSLEGFQGSVHAKLSTVKEGDENWNIDASVDVPLVEDKLAGRIAAYYGENSGIFDRTYIPTWTNAQTGEVLPNPGPAFADNKNVDDEKYYGMQIVGFAQLSDSLSFTPKYMFQRIDADGLPFADNTPGQTDQPRFFDTEEPGSDMWWLMSGTFNWDIDAGTFVSTTSYFDRFLDEGEEETSFLHFLFNVIIGLPIPPLPGPITENESFRSFVHETRFTSSFDGPFQLTAGIFYQRNKNTLIYPASFYIGMNAALGFPIFPNDLIFETVNFFNSKEYAAFAELTFDVSDWLSVTAGGRLYETKTDAEITSDGFANSGFSQFSGTQKENGFNPKVLVQADLSEDTHVYLTASKGYRIGGINGNLPLGLCGEELASLGVDPADTPTYDSDELWSYEAGFKSRFADNRVSLNAAAYFIQWSNIQQLNRLACGFQYIANAGKAESKGFEIELTAVPAEGLTFSLGIGYTQAEITDAAGVAGVTVGDKIQGVPNWTVTSTGEYIFPLSDGYDGMIRADFNHYGRSFSSNNETSAATQRLRPAWTAINLRAGVIKDQWEATLFVNNITNERANLADSRNIAAEQPGRQRLVVNRPRTMGLEFRARF